MTQCNLHRELTGCLLSMLPCVSPSPSPATVFFWPHTFGWGLPRTRIVVGSSGDADADNADDAADDDADDDTAVDEGYENDDK
mgnify:CR=1 FL=1